MRPKISPSEFAEWLKKLPEDVRQYGNKQELKRAKRDYEEFVYNFNRGICVICGKPLKTFSVGSPCLHWLLRPKKLKKKHFSNLFKQLYFLVMVSQRHRKELVEKRENDKLVQLTAIPLHSLTATDPYRSTLKNE